MSCSVYAKLDFAVTCVGNGQSMVLVAEHERKDERVLEGVESWIDATLTTTKPSFNRSELHLAKEDEKQFFYAEFKDWAGLNLNKDVFYFLDRDTLKLKKYSKYPKRIGEAKLVAIYSCQLSPNTEDAHSQVKNLFDKKEEEKELERQRQIKKNKI